MITHPRYPIPSAHAALACMAAGFVLCALTTGCSQEHAAIQPGDASEPATHVEQELYDPKRGVALPAHVATNLQVATAEVRKEEVQPELAAMAHLYRPATSTRPAAAVLWLAPDQRDRVASLDQVRWGPDRKPARWIGLAATPRPSAHGAEIETLIEFDDPGAALKAGATVEVYLRSAKPETALTVPVSAVIHGATGAFVYAANGDHFTRTPVRVGSTLGDRIVIEDGLYEGDTVVSHAAESLWLIELCAVRGGTPCCPVERKPAKS